MILREFLPSPIRKVYDSVTFKVLYPLPYKIAYLKKIATGSSSKSIFSYPEKPKPQHVIYKLSHILGLKITNKVGGKADILINFEDTTIRKEDSILRSLKKNHRILNINCKDISKEHVEQVFKKVFRYGLIINPMTYKGKYVRKSNRNFAHDGVVFTSPQKPEKGYVYQIVIDNAHGKLVKDIRTPIINNAIPFVYYKYRSIGDRFGNTNIKAKMVKTEQAYSKKEIANIIRFCKEIGLDYGELDVLRDRKTNRIYIVDVNNTPAGPPNHIAKKEYKKALTILGETFEQVFLS